MRERLAFLGGMRCIYSSLPPRYPPLKVMLCMSRTCPSAEVPASAASIVFLVEFPVDVVETWCIIVPIMFVAVLVALFLLFANTIEAAAVPVAVAEPSFRCRSS